MYIFQFVRLILEAGKTKRALEQAKADIAALKDERDKQKHAYNNLREFVQSKLDVLKFKIVGLSKQVDGFYNFCDYDENG